MSGRDQVEDVLRQIGQIEWKRSEMTAFLMALLAAVPADAPAAYRARIKPGLPITRKLTRDLEAIIRLAQLAEREANQAGIREGIAVAEWYANQHGEAGS